MGKLDGKTAIVTGAGRGIGRSIALKLASEGAHVVVNDLDEAPTLDVTAEINDGGLPEALAFPGDVTGADFGDRVVDAALEKYRQLDIVVNNAGYIWNTSILKHSDEQWQARISGMRRGPRPNAARRRRVARS
jgi:3-oxoacyl-[acyl-carrier protein] reductase